MSNSSKLPNRKDYDIISGNINNADYEERRLSQENNNDDTSNMEIYQQAEPSDDKSSWWQASISLSSPVLFGAWDGVFTSCMVNIFGVIIFLRSGWIAGNAGLESSIAIIILTESVAVVTVLSAIGICQRGHIVCTGGVYTLLSHVLGSRVATPVSLLYCLSQAISCSLCVLAFGESIVDLLGWKNVWIQRLIACSALLFILSVLALGVTWLIGLQILLVLILLVAIIDFLVGSFITYDLANGVVGYNRATFLNNTGSAYNQGENFFSVLGVFFPMSCGVLAGFNMSMDVRDPPHDIPKGSMAAIFASSAIYLTFSFILSATCDRDTLRLDYMIAEKVSATHVLWLIGLYELSLSSAVGNLCGCPQALMGIGADQVFSILKPLGKGTGPNHVPIIATVALAVVSVAFVIMGQLNSLSVIATVLYLIAYATVNYSYFLLCMSIQQSQSIDPYAVSYKKNSEPDAMESPNSDREECQLLQNKFKNKKSFTIPESLKNFGSNLKSSMKLTKRERKSTPTSSDDNDAEKQNTAAEENDLEKKSENALFTRQESSTALQKPQIFRQESLTSIFQCSEEWTFFSLCHPWTSLAGALVCVVSSFLINWSFTLCGLAGALFIWLIIGIVNPGAPAGVAKFSYRIWFKETTRRFCRIQPPSKQIIITKSPPKFETRISEQSMPNMDFPRGGNFHKVEVFNAKWISLSDEDG